MPVDVAVLTHLRGFASLALQLRAAFEEAALPASFLSIEGAAGTISNRVPRPV